MRAPGIAPACQILRHEVAFGCRRDHTPERGRLAGACEPLARRHTGVFASVTPPTDTGSHHVVRSGPQPVNRLIVKN
jgi:hypothetical protein